MRTLLLSLVLSLPFAAAAVESGAPAPDVTAPLLAASGKLALSSLRGNVVYVDFWASWCLPCRLSMPTLDALARKYGERGFRVVGVNKDVSTGDAEQFLKRVHVGFPLLADGDDAVARAFDVKAMPSGYLIDRKGVVRQIHRGFTESTAAALNSEIEALLKDPR